MEIYYNHKERKIETDEGGELSFQQAMDALNEAAMKGEFIDTNMAFQTLIAKDGDMEAVEEYYRSQDAA